jgi:general secretion pathway protein A
MYERFFGFEEPPFRLTPDPRYLFLSDKHKEALGHLVYGLEEGAGFVAITGEIGAGKTTLLRSFLADPPKTARYAYILNPVLSGVELLEEINHEFGLREKGTQRELLAALNDFLIVQKGEGHQVVLIIDEAQALGGAILEQVRMLSNFETDTAKLLQIVLVGQPELRDLLARADLEQLEQRITVRWHLGPLNREETSRYIRHRLATASGGRARKVFTNAALRRVFSYTGGVPRRINVVCHRALLIAYARDSTSIGRATIARAIEEIEAPRRSESAGRFGPTLRWAVAAAGALVLSIGALFGLGSLTPGGSAVPATADLARALDAVGGRQVPARTTRPGGPRVALAPLPIDPAAGFEAAPVRAAPDLVVAALAPEVLPVPAAEPRPQRAPEPVTVVPQAAPEDVPDAAAPVLAAEQARWIDRAALDDALRQTTAAESFYQGIADLLAVWSVEPPTVAEAAEPAPDLAAMARRRGLELLEFTGNLNVLRVLDLPALLEIDSPQGDGPYFAMVDRVDDERVRVTVGRSTATVSHSALSEIWFGRGLLLWKDVDGLGRLVASGAEGRRVRRLQELLAGVGIYAGPATGIFDGETEEAVMRFQRGVRIEADGKAGPRTLIALYGLSSDNELPGLVAEPEAPSDLAAMGERP